MQRKTLTALCLFTATVLAAMILIPAMTLSASAQTREVSDRRIVTSIGQDYYGGDIGSIFDTTFRTCREACYANPACTALTYNTKAEACFLKSGVERIEPFEGAISARMVETPEATRTLAKQRRGEIGFLPDALIGAAADLAGVLGGYVAPSGQSARQKKRGMTRFMPSRISIIQPISIEPRKSRTSLAPGWKSQPSETAGECSCRVVTAWSQAGAKAAVALRWVRQMGSSQPICSEPKPASTSMKVRITYLVRKSGR